MKDKSAPGPLAAIGRLDADVWAIATVGLTGFLLFGALLMEYVLGMEPCPLCLMQRLWFFLAGLWAAIALAHSPRLGIYPALSILSALVGGGFAIRQIHLQSLPADQVPACGPGVGYMLENFPLSEALAAMTRGTGDCAASAPFLGLELPAWALLGFAAVIVSSMLQWRALLRHNHPLP